MSGKSTFGKDPDRLERLFCVGLDESDANSETAAQATLEQIMVKPGSKIGRFKLLNILGEGGMGIVYLAEQQETVRRKVALKIIKPGMDSKRVIARFEVERQALALLDHLNIAHVYDAGTTGAGRPYFVMEFVKGLSITEHCDRHKLTIEERLRLFQQVCQAVQHAHQKGITHRDIKPSNILVSMQDDKSVPKIIDFGVAKALSQPLTDRTLATEDSQLLGTPEYMSPEQADMATEDIDTRSDIYSLGLLLYVLLTGVLPFDSDTFRTGGLENIRKTIRETDPKTPSTRLVKLGVKAMKLAENRRTEIKTLAKHLRKELEWIPLKAMRKERSERYRSASELADDIENYLNGEALMAGPPGTGYKLKKFIRRNRVLVGGITTVLVVLLAGVIASTLFAVRAERARSQAQEVSDYLLSSVMDAGRDSARLERTWEDFLDNAVKGLEGKFEDQPLVEARLRYSLAHKHMDASKPETARELLERAYQLRRQHLGPEDNSTLQTAMMLGWAHSNAGRHDVAIGMWTDQIETIRRAYGDGHWRIMLLMTGIGGVYTSLGKYDEAEPCLDEALQRWKRLSNPSKFSFNLFGINRRRGQNYLAQGRYAEAEQALGQALELKRPTDVRTLSCMTVLSAVYRAQGRYEKAQHLCETALDTMRQELGEDHWAMLDGKCELGRILMARGLLPEAEKLISEALSNIRTKLGDAHENLLSFINALAVVYTKQGKYADANDLFTEALEGRKHTLGENHPETLETLNDFGVLRREQKNYPEAEKLLHQALDGRQRKLGNNHPATLESMQELAMLYNEQELYDKAEPLLLETVKGRLLKLGDIHPHTTESINNLIALYEAWNKPEKAEEWRAKLPKTEAAEERHSGRKVTSFKR